MSLAAQAALQPGEPAPAVSLPSLAPGGEVISLAALRGKVVYLDFWASWCGPCRISFPQLEQLRQELGPQGFEVLAINLDEHQADADKFLAEVPVSYLLARDTSGDSPRAYQILGMPTGFLIDREGNVRLVHNGYRKSDGAALRDHILEVLGE